ncbi:NUDIX domain-containing protein [Geobacter sp. SVR]|uniref:NUDIX domain-containing protein n=1 Tax=Geobacter sp. SVR TaxID=2495594 RepID=UPI0015643412|nr:NUDIX domain-containing protein [Geobacter sp. SVR]
MKRYVVGFVFTENRQEVALIQKARSRSGFEWQIGKLNGLGGKIRDNEAPRDAMVREFEEESGIHIMWDEWELCGKSGDRRTYEVVVFRAFSDSILGKLATTDEGEVALYRVVDLPGLPIVRALSWLIPLVLYQDLKIFNVEET